MVVITQGRPAILARNLDCLAAQTRPPQEVVVVDSSSEDDLFHPDPARKYPFHLVACRFPSNGMPLARNYGLARSSGELIAYLDDDCLAEPAWLEQLLVGFERHPEAAGLGGCIEDPRWSFDPASPIGRVCADGTVISNFFGDGGGLTEVDCLPGGNMCFRREALLGAGGFDPGFVATNHREDPDFCLRVRRRGGRLFYAPGARVVHLNARGKETRSAWRREFYYRYSFARNEAYFTVKHFWASGSAWKRLLVSQHLRWLKEIVGSGSLVATAAYPLSTLSQGIGIAQALLHLLRESRLGFLDHVQEAVKLGPGPA